MSKQTITLKAAGEQYIAHLKKRGQKPSTIGTVGRTLALLIGQMGKDKDVAKILPVHVSKFFDSEAATMLKGKPRAEPSVLQIRRVVRAALVFWHDRGWLASVPLPASDKRFLEPKEKKQSKEKPKAKKSKAAKSKTPTAARPKKGEGAGKKKPADKKREAEANPTEQAGVTVEHD